MVKSEDERMSLVTLGLIGGIPTMGEKSGEVEEPGVRTSNNELSNTDRGVEEDK